MQKTACAMADLQKVQETHQTEVRDLEDTVLFLKTTKARLAEQNESLKLEVQELKISHPQSKSRAQHPLESAPSGVICKTEGNEEDEDSPVKITREDLLRRREALSRRNGNRLAVFGKPQFRPPAANWAKPRVAPSRVMQHIFALSLKRAENPLVRISGEVSGVDFDGKKLSVRTEERKAVANRRMTKCFTSAQLRVSFTDFVTGKQRPEAETEHDNDKEEERLQAIAHRSLSLWDAGRVASVLPLSGANGETPAETQSAAPAISDSLNGLLEEKDRTIADLRADNQELLSRLQRLRGSAPRKSLFCAPAGESETEESEFLDPSGTPESGSATPDNFFEGRDTRPQRGTDRSKILLDRVLLIPAATKNVTKVSSGMVNKFITKIYQEVLDEYKDSLQGLDAPFHLSKSLVYSVR